MPHSLLKDFKSNVGYYTTIALTTAEIYARDYAEKELDKQIQLLVKDECPPTAELKKTFKKLEAIENVTQNTNSKIQKYKDVQKKLKSAVTAGKVAADLLAHFPALTAYGGPGLIGLVLSFPQGLRQAQSNLLVWLRKTVETIEDDIKAVGESIGSATERFEPILLKISAVKTLATSCATDQNLSLEERQSILDSLNRNTLSGNNALQFTANNGKVFSIEVVTDPNSPQIAPKRKAIAKDNRGIVILEGPLSFSSSTDVLIKELKFRINNQLP